MPRSPQIDKLSLRHSPQHDDLGNRSAAFALLAAKNDIPAAEKTATTGFLSNRICIRSQGRVANITPQRTQGAPSILVGRAVGLRTPAILLGHCAFLLPKPVPSVIRTGHIGEHSSRGS